MRKVAVVPIAIALIAALGAVALGLLNRGPATAASVTPEFLAGASNQGKACADLEGPGQTWTELKLEGDDLTNGDHSDGTLTVTVANLTGDTFDWTSDIGVDGVVVKGGNAGSHFYRYDPPTESKGDTDLGVPVPENNGVSHISFCYDPGEEPTPTPTPTATPTSTPPSEETPTPTPTPAALGETQDPTALPETGQAGSGAPGVGLLLLAALGGLLALAGSGAVAVAVRRRR